MKIIFIIIILIMSFDIFASPLSIHADFGYSFPVTNSLERNDNIDKSTVTAIGVEYVIMKDFSITAEMGYRSSFGHPSQFLDDNISNLTMIPGISAYYKVFDKCTALIGGGMGISYNKVKRSIYSTPSIFEGLDNIITTDNSSNYSFAYIIQAGFLFDITKSIKVGVLYKYLDAGVIEYDVSGRVESINANFTISDIEVDIKSHEFVGRVQYYF